MNEHRTVVIAGRWADRGSELAFVTRSLAGAASRWGPVAVLRPGAVGETVADGAFDVTAIGPAGRLEWPTGLSADCTVVVDELTPAVAGLLREVRPRTVGFLTALSSAPLEAGWSRWRVTDAPDRGPAPLAALYVPVNPVALRQRHHGFGFVGYVLVLPGPRSGDASPPAGAAWLTAGLHDADVVVVQDAQASVWRGRALRGRVTVDTRMDLWRLLAHAAVCVDLAPGGLVARECVEALRFGTPILVPGAAPVAAAHAARGGGATFGDPGELLAQAAHLRREPGRSSASAAGRAYADTLHGDSEAFVAQVGALLGAG